MADAAAQDLAQHVASAFIGRQHAIVDEESRSPGVIGNDAEAGVAISVNRQGLTLLGPFRIDWRVTR